MIVALALESGMALVFLGALLAVIGAWCYNGYDLKSVKILYWSVFSMPFLLGALIPLGKYWLLFAFIVETACLVTSCVIYLRVGKKNISRKNKKRKRGERGKNSFFPIALVQLFCALFPFSQLTYYEYIDIWNMLLIGVGSGLLLGIGIVVWLCVRGYRYLEGWKGGKNATGASALLIVCLCCVIGYCAVCIPNVVFDEAPQTYICKVIEKTSRSYRGNISYYIDVSFKGDVVTLSVDTDTYKETEIGDQVEVEYYAGALGFEYLYLP